MTLLYSPTYAAPQFLQKLSFFKLLVGLCYIVGIKFHLLSSMVQKQTSALVILVGLNKWSVYGF